MKTLLPLLFLTLTFISCNNNTNTKEKLTSLNASDNSVSLEGSWELVSFYNYVDNEVIDSFKTSEGYRQVKIYTPTKVMWSKHVPSDTTEWFAFGSYSVEDQKLKETLEYGSRIMSKIIDERKVFSYELVLNTDSFQQIEIDEDGNRIYSENYARIKE